jgi:DNA polymerase bacteriophage-type
LYSPPGYTIVAIDAAQIEARLTAWLAGQKDLLGMFRQGIDIYKDFAADIYDKSATDVTKIERFNAKTCVLGLGFGMSAGKLLITIRQKAKEDGFDIEYTPQQCEEWVMRYRNRFQMIRSLWYYCNNILGRMERGRADGDRIGPCVVDQLSIVLPSGLRLNYNDLSSTVDGFTYRFGNMRRKIYGAKVVENVVQALDRQHVLEAALRTETRCAAAGIPGIKIAMQIHDENAYVVSDEIARFVAKIANEEMCRPSWWATGLPLSAEVKAGITYGELLPWEYE